MENKLPADAIKIDRSTWPRTHLYDLFTDISEPFHGVCLPVDCTETYRHAKSSGLSLFLSLVHRSLTAMHQVENLMTRIVDGEVWQYKVVHAGSAVGRPDGTIGFAYNKYHPDLHEFVRKASQEVERIKNRTDLERHADQNLVRFSVLPWFNFTSLSHARDFAWRDSVPRITFGKVTETNGRHTMPISIHVHHALADGLHVAQFVEQLERCLASPESL